MSGIQKERKNFQEKCKKISQKIVKFTARNLRQIQGGSGVLKRPQKTDLSGFFEG
jgi:hypothetical protein